MSAAALVSRPTPAHHRIFASTSDVLTGHQTRIKASIPGCSCGESFPEDTGQMFSTLHAIHLAPLVVSHVLRSAAAAVRDELPADTAEAAVSALAGMVRHETRTPQRKAAQQ